MSKPDDGYRCDRFLPKPGRSLLSVAGVAALLMVVLPAAATAQLTNVVEAPPQVDHTPPPPAATPIAGGGYRVQCWQHGRLLFEETHVTLPTEGASRFTLKLAGHDAQGRPVYVAETSNATCRVRYDQKLFINNNPALPR